MWVYWRRRVLVAVCALLLLAGVGAGGYFLVDSLKGSEESPPAPAPKIVIQKQEPQAANDLGFPAFATKNTTRVAGADPVADAAGVALAVHPSTGGAEGPPAVTLVEGTDWPSGIAAASLAGPPVGAPILLSGSDSVPGLTVDALKALAPAGSAATDGRQVFAIGAASAPAGVRTERVPGSNPADIGAAIDRLRQRLSGAPPAHILLVSSDRPEFSMPAAGWAARSGDPVLFVEKEAAPKPTLDALRRHKGVPVFLLAPSSVVSGKAFDEVKKVAPDVQRIGASDPVQNAIEFARYVNGSFGWDINDPGHGMVIASTDRPLDAAAASPLSASGDWGPLLVTDSAGQVPPALRGYLLDLKPGYVDDPTRAVYNHIWLLGDASAITVGFQSEVDDLAEVAKVRSAK